MMDSYTVKITRRARQQLREISQYISNTLRAPGAALRLMDDLEREILSLSAFPARAALTEDEPWRSLGIRRLVVKKYLIYFWIDEGARKVQVTAVIHSRQDQIQHLLNMELE